MLFLAVQFGARKRRRGSGRRSGKQERPFAIQSAVFTKQPTASPGSSAVSTRADHGILQRHADAIAALLTKIFSAHHARATARAAMRIHRVIRGRTRQRLTATAAEAQMVVIVQIALLTKHIVGLKTAVNGYARIPLKQRSIWNFNIIGQRQFTAQAKNSAPLKVH